MSRYPPSAPLCPRTMACPPPFFMTGDPNFPAKGARCGSWIFEWGRGVVAVISCILSRVPLQPGS